MSRKKTDKEFAQVCAFLHSSNINLTGYSIGRSDNGTFVFVNKEKRHIFYVIVQDTGPRFAAIPNPGEDADFVFCESVQEAIRKTPWFTPLIRDQSSNCFGA